MKLEGRRVLVVEDEYFLADEMAHALQQIGAEVVGPVASKDDALRRIRTKAVDLAVLDLNLRGETSLDIADYLSERGVPFIFATGYDGEAIPARFHAVVRWEKPFDAVALTRALAELAG